MKNKVLLLSQYFLPDINAASFRINDLYNALQEQAFDVTVLTAYPQKTSVEEVTKVENVHRIKLEKVNKKSFVNYIRNYFGFMFKSIFYSLFRLKKNEYDYVIVTSPPLFVTLGGLIISFFKRSKLIIDIRDVWPDSAVSAGMLKSGGILYRVTKKIEKYLYKKADIITCVSEPMKQYIYRESKHNSIHVLYNGISPETIEKKSTHISNRNRDNIVIGYAGNIGMVQDMRVILDAYQLLIKDNNSSEFEFVIIGDGIERKKMEEDVRKLNLKNIHFTGPLPKREVLNKLNNADLLFFSLIEDPVFEKTIPSKLFDYLLNNKPIVTSIKGEGRQILDELECALYFEASNPVSLAGALETYKNHKLFYDEAAFNNRDYVINNYDRKKVFLKFLSKL